MGRPKGLLLFVPAFAGLLFLIPPVFAKEPPKENFDPIPLAALLIRDGHYDRARTILAQVDETKKGTDLARLYTLRGLIDLHDSDLVTAKEEFHRAFTEGQTEPIVHVYLAQVHFGLGEFKDALKEIDSAGPAGEKLPEIFLMSSEAHRELGEKSASLGALDEGRRRFPGKDIFLRRKIFLLIELGLYQEAAFLGRENLIQSGLSRPEDAVAVADALRKSGQSMEAAALLETARVRVGPDRDITLELAHAYLDMGWMNSAAFILEQDVDRFPDLASESAELYRRAGHPYRALMLNARVTDQSKKLKQRLALLLEMERYDQAAAMNDALLRVGLLDDENIRYAMAYAFFRTNQFDAAEDQLNQLTSPELFQKASEIRRAMEDCRKAPGRCH